MSALRGNRNDIWRLLHIQPEELTGLRESKQPA